MQHPVVRRLYSVKSPFQFFHVEMTVVNHAFANSFDKSFLQKWLKKKHPACSCSHSLSLLAELPISCLSAHHIHALQRQF